MELNKGVLETIKEVMGENPDAFVREISPGVFKLPGTNPTVVTNAEGLKQFDKAMKEEFDRRYKDLNQSLVKDWERREYLAKRALSQKPKKKKRKRRVR